MIKSKVFNILKYLSGEEIKKFSEFVSSPYFNNRTILVKLFDYYRGYHPEYSDDQITKEKAFACIYPGKKYNDVLFRNLNSDLFTLAEKFLSVENMCRQQIRIKRHLLNEINSRKMLFLFEKNYSYAEKILNENNIRDKNYYFDNYQLLSEKEIYTILSNKSSVSELCDSEKNLLMYFTITILESKRHLIYLNAVFGSNDKGSITDEMINEFLKLIPKEISSSPQVKIQLFALKLNQTSKKEYYEKLKVILNSSGYLLEKERLHNIYFDLLFYIRKTRKISDINTFKELFDIRNKIIENKLFADSNFIPHMFFINHVKAAIRLEKYKWIEDFLQNYSNYLEDNYHDSTLYLCRAYMNYHQGKYKEALNFLNEVKYESTFFNLELKLLTARIYYENKDYEILISHLEAYRMYLVNNKKLTLAEGNDHMIFINLLKKLMKISEYKKYHKLQAFKNEVEKIDILFSYWFLDKANELEKIYFEN